MVRSRGVQPILDRHCVKCHSPDKPDGPKLYPNTRMNKMLISPKPGTPWAKDLTQVG